MLNYEGKQWGLPGSNGSIVFFYNKEIFARVGLSAPPKNVEELEKYCQIIFEKTGKAAFALPAMRDSGIIVYPWIFIWKMFAPKWYDSVRGQWFDEKWQPQLANKEAIDAVRLWAKILRSYGPKGIAAYGYNECVLDFEQGNLAMYMHGPLWSSEFEDPTKSKVAGKVGYAIIESRAGDDKYIPCVPWGYIMSASVSTSRKEAAWKFMNWATSYKISLELGKMGHVENTSLKAMQSPDFEKKVGGELAAALRKASLVMDPAYKPLIPQQGEINDLVAIQLSKVLSQQATPEEAMKEANEKILAIMKRDGYIK
jgi:ABC-type glycerol-3-phosphate transport system substrate-binding protein